MSALVLDTHAWVWWVSKPEKLSRRQRSAIDRTRKRGDGALILSVISGWEVALLVQGGRLRLPVPAMAEGHRLAGLRDPASFSTVAPALHHGAPLLTNDRRIVDSGLVQVIG